MDKSHWGAVAMLAGLIVGAGMLGLPFGAAKSGLIVVLLHIILLGSAVLLTNLYLGEISLKVKENHQLPGLAKEFLGGWGKMIVLFALFVEGVGALTAYLIGEGNAWGQIFNIDPLWPMLIFFAIMATLIWLGLNVIEKYELYLGIGIIIIFTIISIVMFLHFRPENFTVHNPGFIFYPYGLVLFSMAGIVAIPELNMMIKKRNDLRKVIIIGTTIPIVLFIIFTVSVFMALGNQVTEMATLAFNVITSSTFSVIGNLLAISVMATSFLVISLALRDSLIFDYKLPKWLSWFVALFIPLGLVFIGVKSFATVLQVAGAVSGSILGIMVVLMHRKIVKKPLWLVDIFLVLLYLTGMIYTGIYII